MAFVQSALGESLGEIWLYGSFVRGDMWSRRSSMTSDIDLLVLTSIEINAELRDQLDNEIYPMYLECGRQISLQFWSVAKFDRPPTALAQEFKERLLQEGRLLFPARAIKK
ncbi:MAG TPA: nucleotidyltransferase domain-containing protein [Gemmatimonadota bacterium]|nr:nucleotidyltransferase domain-containing protein [Gemmatimonadota bacterium]